MPDIDLPFFAHTLDVVGKILLGITVLRAHKHVVKEHRIDNDVVRVMRNEYAVGVLGIVLIAVGYLITAVVKVSQ